MKIKLLVLIYSLFVYSFSVGQSESSKSSQMYEFSIESISKIQSSASKETHTISYLLHPKASYYGIVADMSAYSDGEVDANSVIVIDNGESKVFVETQGMKMQMSGGMMGNTSMNDPVRELEQLDYSKIQKTAESRTILDSKCYKYILSDQTTSIELWVAPDVKLPNWFAQNSPLIDGYIMAYKITSAEGTMTSETIQIKKNINKTINSKEYKKMF